MSEIGPAVETSLKDFHVLFYDIKDVSKYPTHDFFKLLLVLKKMSLPSY